MRGGIGYLLALVVLFAALAGGAVALAARGFDRAVGLEWSISDQAEHVEQINFFIRHPRSVLGYPASVATTPGFHLLVAGIARLAGIESVSADSWLRIVPFLLGLAVLGMLWRLLRDLCGDARCAALLCLPVLLSKYFLLFSTFFSTENCAYVGYVLLLWAYLRFPERGLAIGLAGAELVLTRQIYLPVIATHALAYFARGAGRGQGWARRAAPLVLGAVPPIAAVAVFAAAWGGLVPPGADPGSHLAATVPNLDPVIEAWSLLGLLATPYALLALPALSALRGRRAILLVSVAATAALLLWLAAPSAYDAEAGLVGGPGRWGSAVWYIAGKSPAIGERAILVLPCLVLGFAAAATMIELAWSRREFPAELAMFAFYVLALSVQAYSFQRYTEVMALFTLSVAAARLPPRRGAACWLFLAAYAAKLPMSLALQGAG